MFDKVFVATPTHIVKRYCAGPFVGAVLEYAPGAEFTIVANSRGNPAPYYRRPGVRFIHQQLDESFYNQADSIHKRIVHSVNFLRDLFLNGKWDYYLSLESDVILNAGTLPALMSDMYGGCSVVTTNCYSGFFTEKEFGQVNRLTMGCTMLTRHAVECIPFRYEPTLLAAHYDALFAHDCTHLGIPMHYDPAIMVEHRHDAGGHRGWHQLPIAEVS